MYSWGSNSAGQLGSRTFRDKASPTEVKDLAAKGVVQVACGSEHSLFLCRCANIPLCCLASAMLVIARRLYHFWEWCVGALGAVVKELRGRQRS